MKTDKHYASIEICPDTGKQMYEAKCRSGVCYICGHTRNGGFSHAKLMVGRWRRPSFIEKWFYCKEPEFIYKEDEDKIMNGLKGE